jgi:hypothetical protein
MTKQSVWYKQLKWSKPKSVSKVQSKDIPQETGLYIFTRTGNPLDRFNVLYVGKADGGKSGLRQRLGSYFRYFRRPSSPLPKRHHGKRDLVVHHRGLAGPGIYLRWAICACPTEVEGGVIDMFDPPYNYKREYRMLDDDESLPYFGQW